MSEQDLVPALTASIAAVQQKKEKAVSNELVKPLETGLSTLKQRCEAITVRNQDDYIAVCELVKEGRSYIKDVGFKLDPGINSAREHLDFLRQEKEKYIGPAKQIVGIAERKGEDWKAEERRKAAAEEERINAERRREAARLAEEQRKRDEAAALEAKKLRDAQIEEARKAGEIGKREAAKLAKQAEDDRLAAQELARKQAVEAAANVQEVKVKPAVPVVAGIKARVNWKYRVLDADKVPREYLMLDEVKIGQMVRSLKKAGEVIPGIEAFGEDGI
jgi:hypothetical protein